MTLKNSLTAFAAASLLALALANTASSAEPASASVPVSYAVAVQNNPLGANDACGTGEPDSASLAPDTLVRALYAVVTGPAGAKKDWARMANLFAPGAIVTTTTHRDGAFLADPQTPAQFAALNDRLLGQRNFYEREVAQQIQSFGHIAHAWSTYETRDRFDGPVRVRGVNAFQLLNDGRRWCILSLTWDAETVAHPIPPAFDAAPARTGK